MELMTARFRLAQMPVGHPLLTAWGWAILLVVILSAVPSGTLVAPRTTGSAFDPATLVVTTRPQPRGEVVAASAARRDDISDNGHALAATTGHHAPGIPRVVADAAGPAMPARGPPAPILPGLLTPAAARAPPAI
jgi:hypothetical protein